MAVTPASIEKHIPDYQPAAWEAYTLSELGNFVHLLAKRAEHRANKDKQIKDVYDAKNYLSMMVAKLDELEKKLGIKV